MRALCGAGRGELEMEATGGFDLKRISKLNPPCSKLRLPPFIPQSTFILVIIHVNNMHGTNDPGA